MRKIFAYIVTVVSLLAMMVFFVPSIKESSNFAMEYTGGFEVLYKTKSSMKEVKDNAVAKTISDGMNKLLDINGVTDAIVTVEDGNYIRVNVTSKNQIISDEIRNLVQNNESYEISFRDTEDNLLATSSQILKEVGASYNGETNYYGYPIIYLNISDTDLLSDITTTVSQASENKLVIWVGFEEGVDSYANIETDSTTAKKVIYNASVSEPLDDEVITITGQYTEEAAKNTVNLINSGTYDYDLEIIQVKSVKEADAIRSRTLILIAVAVATILPIIGMAIYFRLDGVFAIISVLVSEFLTIFFFNKIVGVVNPQVVGAFILSNVALFTLMFIILSKYKAVLKTNKSPIKAYKETFKKNSPIVLDTCVTMLLFSLVTYFIGNNAQHFAILFATSSVAIFIAVYLVERFAMYLTCDYSNKNDAAVIVSNVSTNKADQVYNEVNKDIDGYRKHVLFGFAGLVTIAAVVVLLTSLIFKAPFTFYNDAKNLSTIEIVANEEYFTSEAQVKEFFAQEDLEIELNSVRFEAEDDKYHIIVTSDSGVAKYEETLKTKLMDVYGENTDYEEFYVVYVNDYSNAALSISLKSTLFTSGVSLLLIGVYFALRYKYSYALATVASTVMTALSIVAFFAVTRIPVNSYTIIGISVSCAYSLFILVPLFTRIKEYMNDTKKVYLSYQDRVDCFQKGRNSITLSMLVSTLTLDVLALTIMFFDLTNFSMYLAFVIGSMFTLVYSMIIVPQVWVIFENISDKRKRTFKNRNIAKSKYRTLDEQVFIGLND